MLLNDKNTIKQGFNYLSSDPIMNFFIKNFGDEIDALDRYDDNFAIALCNLIIEQQISFKAAITIKKKFANLIKSFSNKEIIKLDNDTIKSIGLSYRKVSYIKNILRFFEEEKIEFNKLNDEGITKKLCSIKGIGPWTAEMFLLFIFHRPDIFSFGDIALINSVKKNYGIENTSEIKKLTLMWKPYRSIASLLLWKSIENQVYYKKLRH
ncbi:MAG: DNA-3-methyladenine glycosylase 2 family protein [Pelagibacteraceae bacterium TMED267]|jgi:DNA-3-methyladenine glycosylase II|nr:MAG: DNA-3-methyladenine glycosylase 2 family protein [Cryomorphaceae bacterium]RPG04308.1 MAG: DNA-3-methyladenine glycosylase 2 family protein [Pelagibacteraceae bacterium TMED267]|tara:strand:- start:96 stop:722 length:627 start_codon:yes stop_codon:yes gene_type:complete